jgi:hypothetical protein
MSRSSRISRATAAIPGERRIRKSLPRGASCDLERAAGPDAAMRRGA